MRPDPRQSAAAALTATVSPRRVPGPRTPRPVVRRRRKEARPSELIDAALSLFAEKGFAATRSEEVARRAGVSKGTLYLYYPSKEELLKAVISQRLSSEIDHARRLVEQHQGSMSSLMTEVLTDWWRNVFDSPASAVFKLIITEVRNFPDIAQFYVNEVVEPGKQLIGRVVEQGMRSGEFRTVDPRVTVMSLLLPMVMLCLHKHSLAPCMPADAEVDPHLFIQQHVELVLRGLQAPAEGSA